MADHPVVGGRVDCVSTARHLISITLCTLALGYKTDRSCESASMTGTARNLSNQKRADFLKVSLYVTKGASFHLLYYIQQRGQAFRLCTRFVGHLIKNKTS